MKTKSLIKNKARELFNRHGVMNITLRDVARELNKSYGNLTYHYPKKETLIMELYEEMNIELLSLQSPNEEENLLSYFLNLPALSYEMSLKYIFFLVDFIELKRNYTKVFSEMARIREERKLKWKLLLNKLRSLGYFNDSITAEDLDYIMFLSGSVRAAYFQIQPPSNYSKKQYVKTVNSLLKPYLSIVGLDIYRNFKIV